MNDILSQEEIDALLRSETMQQEPSQYLSPEEIDALGEMGNISMGTAATTLSTLINRKVTITTPEVTITTIRELGIQYPIPFVAVEVLYTQGLEGSNLLIIQEKDVKIITELLMGGDGTNIDGELSELHLSAISEVMNQMIGSASTSLAAMFNKNIYISPPKAFIIDFSSKPPYGPFNPDEPMVKVNFKMEVDGLIDSYLMQLLPIDFAQELIRNLLYSQGSTSEIDEFSSQIAAQTVDHFPAKDDNIDKGLIGTSAQVSSPPQPKPKTVDVRPVSFQPLSSQTVATEKKNIDLILDVPLQVSVELGKTSKLIKEILELNSGSIIELDKMAGEPVDVLVNGKMIAKGEVVVIDDSFGVRITDIISPVKRISNLK
jgi:flagellar motor switch protein FliN/FliY